MRAPQPARPDATRRTGTIARTARDAFMHDRQRTSCAARNLRRFVARAAPLWAKADEAVGVPRTATGAAADCDKRRLAGDAQVRERLALHGKVEVSRPRALRVGAGVFETERAKLGERGVG